MVPTKSNTFCTFKNCLFLQEFCDLEKSSPFGTRGPQRLSTENDLNPTAGPVQDENPLFQINGVTISSTTVFIVDDVTVIFIGTDMGEIRKVKRILMYVLNCI